MLQNGCATRNLPNHAAPFVWLGFQVPSEIFFTSLISSTWNEDQKYIFWGPKISRRSAFSKCGFHRWTWYWLELSRCSFRSSLVPVQQNCRISSTKHRFALWRMEYWRTLSSTPRFLANLRWKASKYDCTFYRSSFVTVHPSITLHLAYWTENSIKFYQSIK